MKLLYVVGLLLAIGINDIARINTLKQEAKTAYESGDYETALEKYEELTDDLNVTTDEIALNMAHARYHLQDTAQAIRSYNELSAIAEDNKIKSVAYNQVGVLHTEMDPSGKNDQAALNAFKAALKADPTNSEARYNYEVLKKKMKEKEQQNQDQQNKDQNQDDKDQDKDQKDQQDKDQKGDKDKENKDSEEKEQENKENQDDKEGEEQENKDKQGQDKEDQEKKDGEKKDGEQNDEEKKGDEKEGEKPEENQEGKEDEKKDGMPQSAADKLKELNISPQQAKMLLEAMKDQEVQYLQQLRRRPTKKRQSGKPDW